MQTWDQRYREEIAEKDKIIESLLISREPNPDDAPYRPAPIPNPGKPPWPGYPNPPKLASLQIRPNQIMLPFVPKDAETDDMYGEGVDEIEGLGNQANIKDSLQRENVGGTLRDMMLPLLIKEYGKDGSGGYKNPGALLSGMRKLV